MTVRTIGHGRYALTSSGSSNISVSLASTYSWSLEEVRLHLTTGVGTANNFTVTINSSAGSALDTLLLSQDMTSVQDVYWIPERKPHFAPGDRLNFAWTNASSGGYGLEVIFSKE
jgi:hypothetical protein